jgi:hypothetical protein
LTVFFWGHLEHQDSGRRGYLALSLAGVVVACSADWPGFVVIGVVLAWGLLRTHVLPPTATPALAFSRYTRWWALTATLAVLAFITWVALFYLGDRIQCWLEQAQNRKSSGETLSDALARRRPWIDLSFTPPAILLGKLAAPIAVLRLLWRRRDEELLSLAVLLGAVVQYVGFGRGADVHPFWPHYFGLYFALAFAQLLATIRDVVSFVAARLGSSKNVAKLGEVASLTLLALTLLLILPDAVRGLRYWRTTFGNYGPSGNDDTVFVLEKVVRPMLEREQGVQSHRSASWGCNPVWIARGSRLSGKEWREIAQSALVRTYGDIWTVKSSELAMPLEAHSLNERAPSFFEWAFVAAVHPKRSIDSAADPFLTWELRAHLDQPSEPPTRPPSSDDELRIAHNAATAAGNSAQSSELRGRLLELLDTRRAAELTAGIRLLGTRIVAQGVPKLEIWFQASGALTKDFEFTLKSTIVKRAKWSFIPADPTEQRMSVAPPIPTSLWRAGFVYVLGQRLYHRPGEERLFGEWAGDGAPKPAAGGDIELASFR